MTIHRRILKRTRTIERISVKPNQRFDISENFAGGKFRVEIYNESEEKIYDCEIFGSVEVEKLSNGEIQIIGKNTGKDKEIKSLRGKIENE